MRTTSCKRRMTAFYPAAVFAVLVSLSLFLAAPGICGVKADPNTGGEALIVLENSTGSHWNQLSRLNVFANSKYNGQSIISPDSNGEYAFTIQNSARFPLQYTLQITDENAAGVPMEYRLKQGENYVVGSESVWSDVSNLSAVAGDLPYESEAVYTLEWRWRGDNDEADTDAGTAVPDGAKYLLNFGITAEQNGEPIIDSVKPPQTGGIFNAALWLALTVSSGILLALLIWMKRRNTENEEDLQNA